MILTDIARSFVDQAAAKRQQLATDIHRPRYHFLPPSNWMNDPNGFIQWEGQYHLFYQYNPFGATWGNMHWGHAVSTDLIHWTDLPIAIAPTPGSYDEAGIFSGCMVNHNGVPTIFYTATADNCTVQTQAIATSGDGLITWTKHADNPVISAVPALAGQTRDFRDPFVWKDGNWWYMVLGSRIQDVGGVIFLYRSADLHHWEYLHPLLTGDIHQDGVIWECPNFFQLGDEWVLIISTHDGKATATTIYFVGSYENQRFTPVYRGVLDDAVLYAPLSTVDEQQRRVLFGWLREDRSGDEMNRAGWSGVQSIPRVLTLDTQHRVHMVPVPELKAIRGHHQQLTAAGSINVSSAAVDIEAQITGDGTSSLSFVYSSTTQEQINIRYDAAAQQLVTTQTVRGSDGAPVTKVKHTPHSAATTLNLRILVDGSVVEIIADEVTSSTQRVYPSAAGDCSVRLSGSGTADVWEMPSIWQLSQ
ncbi:MAG: glycoside hydrolase family 32 protein [Anaerolineae bacterium]|nr:glycoside hydrolase family 32 protein [Anaerolineae bacterium]